MILQRSSRSVARRSAFTLLEVLVVVAIILVLASVATVAVLKIQKENKADIAKIQAKNLATALKTFMVKNDGNAPGDIQEILRYVEGGTQEQLKDPWGQFFQIDQNETGSYYVYTTHPETGERIRSDTK